MKKYVIFGTNGMAKDLCNFIESDGDKVEAYTLDEKYIKERTFYGKEIIPYEGLGERYKKNEITILVIIGYSKMNEVRRMILERCKKDGWDISSFIHSSVFNLSKSIGDGNIVGPFVDIGSDSVIGEGNIINSRSEIGHDVIIGDYNFCTANVHIGGGAKVGNNNFLGLNCTIESGIKIEDYNIVGAGTVLNKEMQSHMVAAPQAVRMQYVNMRGMELLLMRELHKKE